MFNSGFPFHFQNNIFTLPCRLGQIPDLSTSTVFADAWDRDAGKLLPRMVRKVCRWELKRQDLPGSQAQPHSQALQRLEQSPGNGRTQHSSWTGFSPCPAEPEVIDLLPPLRLSPMLPRLLLFLSDELARPLAWASFLYLIDFVSSVYT